MKFSLKNVLFGGSHAKKSDATSEGDAANGAIARDSQESGTMTEGLIGASVGGGYEQACFAAGCFWGVESTFGGVLGVRETAVGYTGGNTEEPTYEQVCGKKSGHAEAVRVVFDPSVVTYRHLCEVFWNNHDPTQLNRQGPDHGSQYRSAVFYYSDEQKAVAEASRDEQQKKLGKKIVTQMAPAGKFHFAEGYHQKYHLRSGRSNLFRMIGLKGEEEEIHSTVAAKLNGYITGQFEEGVKEEILALEMSEELRAAIQKSQFVGGTCRFTG